MLGGHAEDGKLMWPSIKASREQFSLTFFYKILSSTMSFEEKNQSSVEWHKKQFWHYCSCCFFY